MRLRPALLLPCLLIATSGLVAAPYPSPTPGDFVIHDFRFENGEHLAELSVHYVTLGTAARDASGRVTNAVLILHGTTGSSQQFLTDTFAGVLFGPGQLLDASRYYLILPDGIGTGKSSKPSDGLHARFPHYCYHDMIEAQYQLLTRGLGVDHLRLVIGTSMGGMHTWLWGELHPGFMDALMPLASFPVEIAGRNRMLRRMILDAIRTDPEWKGGEYTAQPRGLYQAMNVMLFMVSTPLQWQKDYPDREVADRFYEDQVRLRAGRADANDLLYQFDASRDYNPQPRLAEIRAPLLAINSADDQVNPPELGILDREIRNVPQGQAVVLPISDATRGHGTHSLPVIWQGYLAALLAQSEPGAAKTPMPAASEAEAARLEALERELVAAIGRKDLATYDRIVADDYAVTDVSGKAITKPQIMASYRDGTRGYRDLTIYDVVARVYGDTAVVTARTRGFRVEDGHELENRVRYIRVFARRGGTWRAVAQMAAPEAEAPPPTPRPG